MADPGGRPPDPEPGFRLFEFFRERERGELSVFKGLQKSLSAQIKRIEDELLAAYPGLA
jgi:hypothetical protein